MLSASTPPLLAFTLIFEFFLLKSATSLSRVTFPWSDWPCHIVIVTVPSADAPSSLPPPHAASKGPAPARAARPRPPRRKSRRDARGCNGRGLVTCAPSLGCDDARLRRTKCALI